MIERRFGTTLTLSRAWERESRTLSLLAGEGWDGGEIEHTSLQTLPPPWPSPASGGGNGRECVQMR